MRRPLALMASVISGAALAIAGAPAAQAAQLPDGRAWEIVTPQDQNNTIGVAPWIAPDGSAAAFSSNGAFSGGQAGNGDGYVSRRGAGGWTTEAMAPPSGAMALFSLLDVSADAQQAVLKGGAYTDDGGAVQDVYIAAAPHAAVNVSDGVTESGDQANYVGATPTMSHVLFGVDHGSGDPAQLYDFTGGQIRPVGILPGETTPAAGGAVLGSYQQYGRGSVLHAISADGSRIFFESPVPAGTFSTTEPSGLYVREDGQTTRQIDPSAIYWGAAVDGSTAVYTPVDGSGNRGLSTYGVDAGQATVIAPPSAQVQGVSAVSDDASRIAFVALGDLANGATAGQPNLYLDDAGTLRFVATLNAGEAISYGGFYSTGGGRKGLGSAGSADGRLLAFVTSKRLGSFDNHGMSEVYLYDAGAPASAPICISCNTTGAAPLGHATLQLGELRNGVGVVMLHPTTNITVDDRRVFFVTADALDPLDTNGDLDVYEWEDGAAHLISSGMGAASRFIAASPSGDDVLFLTQNVLVPQNTTRGIRALYDARVGGGFPLPVPVTPCDQDGTCQGPPPAQPLLGVPASAAFAGTGNVTEPAPPARNAAAARLQLAPIGTKARRRLARGARIVLRVRVGAAGRVTAVARARVGKQRRVVARGSRMAHGAGTVRLGVRLNKAARRALRAGKRLRVTLVVDGARARRATRKTFTLVDSRVRAGHAGRAARHAHAGQRRAH